MTRRAIFASRFVMRASVAGLLLLLAACSLPSPNVREPIAPSGNRPSPATKARQRRPPRSEVVQGWPATGQNPPGVYSWDGSSCTGTSCIVGFMHNGYGSGSVDITIERAGERATSNEGAEAVTVAGHDGIYQRIDARTEEWIVKIEGTTIAIRLKAEGGTTPTELAEAHAIIDSMHTEKRGTNLGFRLIFTLTTDDWDSG